MFTFAYLYAVILFAISLTGYSKTKARTSLIPLYLGFFVFLSIFLGRYLGYSASSGILGTIIIAVLACLATARALPKAFALMQKKDVKKPLAVILKSITFAVSFIYIIVQL